MVVGGVVGVDPPPQPITAKADAPQIKRLITEVVNFVWVIIKAVALLVCQIIATLHPDAAYKVKPTAVRRKNSVRDVVNDA